MTRRCGILVIALGTLGAASARSEVSVDRPAPGVVRVHFQAGARGPWGRVRPLVAPTDVLDSHGDAKGDSWPIAYDNPGTGRPEAVWSTVGEDADIVFSSFVEGAWQAPIAVSDVNGADQLPAVDADEYGNRFVAWDHHRNARHCVEFAAVAADDGGQTAPIELSSRPRQGRLPSLLVGPAGEVWVAYEEGASSSCPSVVVGIDRVDVSRRPDGVVACGGEVPIDVARSASFTTHLDGAAACADVRLVRAAGSICATWTDSDDEMATSCLVDGAFTDPVYSPIGGGNLGLVQGPGGRG